METTEAAPVKLTETIVVREELRCEACHHGWDAHGFVGKRGGKPASIKCIIRHPTRCPCEIRLPTEKVRRSWKITRNEAGIYMKAEPIGPQEIVEREGGSPSQKIELTEA